MTVDLPSQTKTKVPILVYHSQNISGNTYETNDHVALYQDLRMIHSLALRIVPLLWIVEWVLGQREETAIKDCVALTFDDGTDFDYCDLIHPSFGFQRSFYNILQDFQSDFGPSAQPHLHATSFVIASPQARSDLCKQTLAGLRWMNEHWWVDAHNSGLMSIQNHSWDHNHVSVTAVCEENQNKGQFDTIDTYEECRQEIVQAGRYIAQKTSSAWPTLFAYPYGQSSDYLRAVYFPCFAHEHRTIAAFGADGGYVTKLSSRWNLPRFVCGAHWQDPETLSRIVMGQV